MRTAIAIITATAFVGLVVLLFRPGGHVAVRGPTTLPAPVGPVVYRTDPPIEPDTCVAAWVLTRLVSPGSKVLVAEESEATVGSIPFDVPKPPYMRQQGKSVSRLIVEQHAITDPFAVSVTKVAQELEIMPWTTNSEPFFARVRDGLADAVNSSKSEQECMNRALRFIDALRKEPKLKSGGSPDAEAGPAASRP